MHANNSVKSFTYVTVYFNFDKNSEVSNTEVIAFHSSGEICLLAWLIDYFHICSCVVSRSHWSETSYLPVMLLKRIDNLSRAE